MINKKNVIMCFIAALCAHSATYAINESPHTTTQSKAENSRESDPEREEMRQVARLIAAISNDVRVFATAGAIVNSICSSIALGGERPELVLPGAIVGGAIGGTIWGLAALAVSSLIRLASFKPQPD